MSPEPNVHGLKYFPKSTDTIWARMRFWVLAFLPYILSLLTIQCGLDIEDSTAPTKPQWVEKSLPEEWPEKGIDAHEGDLIYLEWHFKEGEDIDYYEINRSFLDPQSNQVTNSIVIGNVEPTSQRSTINYFDTRRPIGIRYFYHLFAVDASGNRSESSDTISYKLILGIPLDRMRPNTFSHILSADRRLAWAETYELDLENYLLTILNPNGDCIHRVMFPPRNYLEGWDEYFIPDSIQLIDGGMYQWRIELHSNAIAEIETGGSESYWAGFTYSEQ